MLRLPSPARLLLAPALLVLLVAPARAEERAFDKNGDGKPDKWAKFEGEWPVEIRYDTNFDGKVDQWEILANGRMQELREDRNFDGTVDRIVTYKSGFPSFKQIDDDMDGRFDRLVFYDGSEDVRTASPELARLLSEQAGYGAPVPKKAASTAARAPGRPTPAAPPPPPADSAEAYFDLGDPALKIPLLGGLDPASEWKIERDPRRFRGLAAGKREFELQHLPTGGVLWVDRMPLDGEAPLLEYRMSSFADLFTRRLMAAQRDERTFRTPYGAGSKRRYLTSDSGGSKEVALYVLAGPRDIVYLRGSAPAANFSRFEKLTDALVFGLRVHPTPAALP